MLRPNKVRFGLCVLGDVLEESNEGVTEGAKSLNDRRDYFSSKRRSKVSVFVFFGEVADPPKGLRASTT